MSNKELNIGNALLTSVEILKRMISGGLNDPKMFLYVSNMLTEEFCLTREESIIVIENAVKLC